MVNLRMPVGPRAIRTTILPLGVLAIVVLLLHRLSPPTSELLSRLPTSISWRPDDVPSYHRRPANAHPPPKYLPTPTGLAPPVTDPFPLLARSSGPPPPVPPYNVPRPKLHGEYGLSHAPPLLIGFTRQWPMLLQCVVSYLTAGWPPEAIYVVENTGVQGANEDGRLTLQNPFYLNHTTLRRLGVNVVRTPVLLSFAQMQNFFLHLAHERAWPWYFYSHQDVLVFSFEDGADTTHRPGDREWEFDDDADEAQTMRPPAAGQPGYRTIYENCLRELNRTIERDQRWGWRWFQYDHLTLVNRAALDAVGGWDTWIPYYATDCDMNGRLAMEGFSMRHRRVGIINDVSSTLEDLAAMYRLPGVTPKFVDPNPIKVDEEKPKEEPKPGQEPTPEEKPKDGEPKPEAPAPPPEPHAKREEPHPAAARAPVGANPSDATAASIEYFRQLLAVSDAMGQHKYRAKDVRNSWQKSQHGGEGEPFHYDAAGFARAFDIVTEAGREVYRQKWGHRDCDIYEGTALQVGDQWKVQKDWE